MKVAFCALPLKTGHRTRGVGFYTRNVLENLKERAEIELQEFEDIKEVKDADIVHYPWFDLFFRTLPLKKKFPTVVTIHDVTPLLFPLQYPPGIKGRINLEIQKLSLRSCQSIITISNTSRNDITRYLKIRPQKTVVTYEAASDQFEILSEAMSLRIKRKFNLPDRFLLYVGDANFNKNVPFLIEGFNNLKKLADFQDLKLVLIGNVYLKKLDNIDHPELKSLKRAQSLITEFGLEKEIITPGQIATEDLVGFYNLATVYIQPSIYEGFGLPVLEAFSCGAPVVCSNTPSLREIGGNAAIYFNPKDLNQFIRLIVEVLQSRSLQDKLSKLGVRRAGSFSWEKTTDETIKIYKNSTK